MISFPKYAVLMASEVESLLLCPSDLLELAFIVFRYLVFRYYLGEHLRLGLWSPCKGAYNQVQDSRSPIIARWHKLRQCQQLVNII